MPSPLAPRNVKHNNRIIMFCVLGCATAARSMLGEGVTVGTAVISGKTASFAGVGVAVKMT